MKKYSLVYSKGSHFIELLIFIGLSILVCLINKCAPQFNWTKIPKEIIVVVRNSLTYEEFTEEFDESFKKFSNSFENIEIYTLLNGKKQKFFEEETA